MPIRSFSDKETEEFFLTGRVRPRAGWGAIHRVVKRKLDMLHYAAGLQDLNAPPGNRLKALKGEWQGYHSIRINDQWRLVFRWTPAGPTLVRVADYH